MKVLDSTMIHDNNLRDELDIMKSRLELRQGKYHSIIDRLKDYKGRYKDRLTTYGSEGYALLAIAARETGDKELFRKAFNHASRNGVNMAALLD